MDLEKSFESCGEESSKNENKQKKEDDAMTNIMTPSTEVITAGQIGKIQENLGAALRKSGLQNESVQKAIEQNGSAIIDEMVVVLRKYAEKFCNLFTRFTKVDRSLKPQAILDATGRKQYTDSVIVADMPKGDGDEAEVVFFKLGHFVNDADLEKEYEMRGLVPADPYSLAKVNQDDLAFADEHPNGTHWKNTQGNWCFASFNRWDGERTVDVNRLDSGWHDYWSFAGLRK